MSTVTEEALKAARKALASQGGKARVAKMTAEARKASAQKAVNARWAKYRRQKQAEQEKQQG